MVKEKGNHWTIIKKFKKLYLPFYESIHTLIGFSFGSSLSRRIQRGPKLHFWKFKGPNLFV